MKKINIRLPTIAFILSTLFSLVFIMPVFTLDRPIIWDDWVWIHNSPEQLRDVAIQLGLWWLAEVNVFIYKLKNPNLFLSSLAFVSHIASIAILGKFFVRKNIFNDIQCSFWIACCIASPYVIIRYTNSVAFYNLYYSLYILAAYIYIYYKNYLLRSLSAGLFLISFSLSSLIPSYFLIILFSDKDFFDDFIKKLGIFSLGSRMNFSGVFNLLKLRLFEIRFFLCLPFVFYLLKLLSWHQGNPSNPYQSYNVPQFDTFISAPVSTVAHTLELTTQVIFYGFSGFNSFSLFLGIAIALGLFISIFFLNKISFLCADEHISSRGVPVFKSIVLLFLFSCTLVFPYGLVGKYPELGSMINARHFLPAQAFVFAIAILFLSALGRLIGSICFTQRFMTILLLSMFSAFCVSRAIHAAAAIWWENKISSSIVAELKAAKSDIHLWVFDNQIPEYLGDKRWSYIYTGYLVSAFGTKDNFGIAKEEYLKWNQPVRLLNDPYYRLRYNFDNYIHQDSYNYVVIKSLKDLSNSEKAIMYIIESFDFKKFKMDKFLSVNISSAFGCVDQTVSLISGLPATGTAKTLNENLYCEMVLAKHCKEVKERALSIPLNSMEYAYAIQRYPGLLSEDGLYIFNKSTDFAQITQQCSLLTMRPSAH